MISVDAFVARRIDLVEFDATFTIGHEIASADGFGQFGLD
jgi:hypothetical protein